MSEALLEDYQNKLETFQNGLSHAQEKQGEALLLLLGVGIASVVVGFLAFYQKAIPLWSVLLCLPVAALCVRRWTQQRRASRRQYRLTGFYRTGVARLNGEWAGKGSSGDEFSVPGHLYERDLDILGSGSLFELICTARTNLGRSRIAKYLLDLPAYSETIARQEAVRELQPQADLREEICLLGSFGFQECDWTPFREWLDAPALTVHRLIPSVLRIVSCVVGILILAIALSPLTWESLVPILIGFLALEAVFGFQLAEQVRPVLQRVRAIDPELEVLRQGLQLLAKQQFHSVKLKQLVEAVQTGDGVANTRRLQRLVKVIHECSKDLLYVPSLFLLLDTQFVLAIETWKAQHGEHLKAWIDAWAEFEALNSLAGYAHEHPADIFPEMLKGVTAFEARDLGHPLLPVDTCVTNDVHFSDAQKLYVISGSNMAGKSTFLRSVGITAVLASAGAPVRAASIRLSSFAVCASLSIVDSLQEGKSKFLAEVERLRDTLLAAQGEKPVLFVIDEIFAGTNSHDRRIAAEAVIRTLIGAGAVGALSTHDLALTEIADKPELRGLNVHMASPHPADPLAFDYRLKPGVNRTSNALAIARLAGVPV